MFFFGVILFSDNEELHRQQLDEIFKRFDKFGITININKCIYGQSKVEFLGHEVSTETIRPSQEQVDAIRLFP